MRITFVFPVADMGGGSKVVAIYAKALVGMGHTVKLISVPPPALPLRRRIGSLLKGKGWPQIERGRPSHFDGSGLDHSMLERWRPVTDADVPDADVVVATWWETAEWVAALNPRKGAKVYFIQAHEIFPHLPLERCRATYKLPLHKVVVARWLQEVMREEYGDKQVDLVPNSVDPAQFRSEVRGRQTQPTAGFIYSTAGVKAVDVTLAALASVHDRCPELRVLCFGSEALSPAIPLPAYATYLQLPPQDRICSLYASCDVWVSASRSEGFNLPALEAMACRTPVVSTRTGWPEEVIVNRHNGVLTEIDDVDAIASGVEWILRLPDAAWRALSQRAYETAHAGSWEDSARLFEGALVNACGRAARAEIGGWVAPAAATAAAKQSQVWIVIVNYRTARLTIDCLHSLAAERAAFPGFHTVIVDNASGDGSPEQIEAAIADNGWRDWADVIASNRNGGFAYGNNIGIERALTSDEVPDFVMLLNPDTVVRPGALKTLVEFMEANPQAGIAGSLLEDAAGGIDCSAHNAFSPLGELVSGASLGALSRLLPGHTVSPPVRNAAHECDWVSGASLMIRTAIFDEIGLLDDQYFLYFEEADFCYRAKKTGWQVWFVPASRIVHLEGAATGIRDVVRRRPRYWYESRRRYFIKHYGVRGLMQADLLWAFGRMTLALRRLLRLGAGRAGHDPKWYARDLLLGDLRSFLDGRTWQIR